MRSPAAPALDYRPFGALRLTLALLVMLQHFFAHLAPGDFALWARPFEIGTIAVLVFFALSGFVIAEAADRLYQQRPIAFMLNRLLRIVPHFFTAVMLVWLAYLILARTGALSAARYEEPLSANAFGLMNVLANLLGFLPGSNRVQSDEFLLISWAIRVEMVFYVIAALWLAAAGVPLLVEEGAIDSELVGVGEDAIFRRDDPLRATRSLLQWCGSADGRRLAAARGSQAVRSTGVPSEWRRALCDGW